MTPIRSVVPVGRLHGQSVPDAVPNARDFAVALVARAAGNNQVPQIPGDLGRLANGGWISQFPTTVPEAFAPLKLTVLRDQWSLTMAPPENGTIIFRKSASGGFWSALSSKRAGLELTVKLPATGKTIGEVTVIGQVYGEPDRTFLQAAQTAIPKLIEEVRRELGNVSDRRKSPRLAADFPMTVHPLHSDGTVDPSIPGRCRDISAGGVCFTTVDSITTRYAYLEFGGGAANAVLVKLIRSQPLGPGGSHVYAGPFRLDL